jgi:hypothetical protein
MGPNGWCLRVAGDAMTCPNFLQGWLSVGPIGAVNQLITAKCEYHCPRRAFVP